MAYNDRSLNDFNEYLEHYRQLGSEIQRARCKSFTEADEAKIVYFLSGKIPESDPSGRKIDKQYIRSVRGGLFLNIQYGMYIRYLLLSSDFRFPTILMEDC